MLYCAKWVDLADGGDADLRALAEQRLAVLTPIAKGALSEWASEATDLGIQIPPTPRASATAANR